MLKKKCRHRGRKHQPAAVAKSACKDARERQRRRVELDCTFDIPLTIELPQAVINLRGVLGLEMFVTKDESILANEIAPRTHNSGHWTIDACEISQFENHVRAVCGLPVKPQNRHSDAVMINLIGNDVLDISRYESQENARVHIYGKQDVKPGRKMGHVTMLYPLSEFG